MEVSSPLAIRLEVGQHCPDLGPRYRREVPLPDCQTKYTIDHRYHNTTIVIEVIRLDRWSYGRICGNSPSVSVVIPIGYTRLVLGANVRYLEVYIRCCDCYCRDV